MSSPTTEQTAICDAMLVHHVRSDEDLIHTSCGICGSDSPATHRSNLVCVTDPWGAEQRFDL